MKDYICHKRVKAAQIIGVEGSTGADFILSIRDNDGMARCLALPLDMVARYQPVAGDYLVEYTDGYRSISPKQPFEEGYTLAPLPELTGHHESQSVTNVLPQGAALEAAIAGTPGQKVTKDQIEGRISDVAFYRIPDSTVTICSITLDNGYSVRGESACVDHANYRREIGDRIAYDNAFDKLWPLFGFLLAESRGNAGHAVPLEESIARICHEVNRAACAAFGDHSQVAWEQAPDWQRESAVNGVQFVLANPDAPPSASHDSWLEEKRATGWRYGPVKDVEAKTHPCFLPYDDLPPEQKLKDYLFQAVVKTMVAQAA